MSSPEHPSSPASRPRIRRAHSYEYSHRHRSAARPSAVAGHWYGDDGVLYYRSDEGTEFYCASDGGYYPRELLSGALAASSPRMLGGSAEHDRSTYYEYIARHSAEPPAQPGAAAEAPAAPSAVPPRPATPPPAAPDAAAAPGSAGAAGGAGGAGGTHDAGAAVAPAAARDEGRRRPTGRWVVGAIALLAVLAVGIGLGVTFLGPDRGVRATAIETPEPDPGPNG